MKFGEEIRLFPFSMQRFIGIIVGYATHIKGRGVIRNVSDVCNFGSVPAYDHKLLPK